jgi:hypothetical protein
VAELYYFSNLRIGLEADRKIIRNIRSAQRDNSDKLQVALLKNSNAGCRSA